MRPAVLTESQNLIGYIDEMLDGIRNSAHGLSDEQARSRPLRSQLSIGGIIKHSTWVMREQLPDLEQPSDFQAAAQEFFGSFTPTAEETLDSLLTAFDEVRTAYLAQLATLDPDATITVGPKPWDDQPEPEQASQRLLLAHHIDEFARHAGHADIIREELDGAQAMPLLFAVQGRQGNAFISPWQPEDRAAGAQPAAH